MMAMLEYISLKGACSEQLDMWDLGSLCPLVRSVALEALGQKASCLLDAGNGSTAGLRFHRHL